MRRAASVNVASDAASGVKMTGLVVLLVSDDYDDAQVAIEVEISRKA